VAVGAVRKMGARRVLAINLKGGLNDTGPRHVFDVMAELQYRVERSAGVWRGASDLVRWPDVKGLRMTTLSALRT